MKKLLIVPNIILALLLFPVYFFAGIEYLKAALLSYALSFFVIIFSFISIRWAFHKGNKVLYTTLFVGMAIRFAVFILALYLVHSFTKLPIIAFVLTFMMFYLVLQFQEIKVVTNELRFLKVNQSDK
jgi:hypothetical protein